MFIEGVKASKHKKCILEKQVFAAIDVWEGVEVCGRCMGRGELCGRCGGVWEV